MACSCGVNKKINSMFGFVYNQTKPFDVCPLCASKHLDYALIKYDTNIHRSIANIYLAYKHLNKYFNTEAMTIFNLINLYFSNALTYKDIEKCVEQIHTFANQYVDSTETFEEKENLKLESLRTNYEKIYLNFIAVNELYNFEVGYKDINTPFCIGLLEEASEYADNDVLKNKIRNIWKRIEEQTKLDSEDILNFAADILYRQNKDNFYQNK